MKKLIALLLVLTLLLGMIPPALAAEETTDSPESVPDTGNCILSDITIDPELPEATVELATTESARLMVAMFAETGAMVGFGMTAVSASEDLQQIPVELQMSTGRPAYFSLRAFLVDDWFVPLCESLYCFTYTRGFAEFQDVTAADFPNQTALEGEDNNLLVLAPGVIELIAGTHFTALSTDEETSIYTLTGAAGTALTLKPGDVVWMVDENGIQHSVKVGSVSKSGNAVTITAAQDAQVSDFVSFVRLEVQVDQEDAVPYVEGSELTNPVQLQGAVPEDPGTDIVTKKELSLGTKFRPNSDLSVDLTAKMTLENRTSVFYSPEHLESKDLYVKMKNVLELSVGVTASGSLNNNVNDKEFEITLLPEIRIPISTGVEFKMKMSVPILLELKGSVSLSWAYKNTLTTISQDGSPRTHSTFEEQKPDANLDLKAQLTFRMGIRFTVGIVVMRALDLSVTPEGGIEVTGNVDPTVGTPTTERWHKCSICIDGKFSVYFKAGIALKLGIGKWKVTIFDYTFVNNRVEYGKCHWSPAVGFGWGSCDNFEYRIRVYITDNEGRSLTNATTKIYSMQDFAEGGNGMVDYLRPGDYFVETTCEGYEPNDRTLTMGKSAQEVTITLTKEGEVPPSVGDTITKNVYFEFTGKINNKNVKSYVILRPSGLMTFQENEPPNLPYNTLRGVYPGWRNSVYGAIYYPRLNTIKEVFWLDHSMTELPKESFANAPQLTTVNFNGTAVDIGERAFAHCEALTTVQNSANVKKLGPLAFWGSGITEIDLQNAEIGREAFAYCEDLEAVQLGNCTIDGSAFFGCISLKEIDLGSVTEIGESAFRSCSSLQSVDLPRELTEIGDSAFRDTALKRVSLPNGLKELKLSTFTNCVFLESVSLPNSLETIGNGAFSGCTALTSISIPNSVTELGSGVFSGCSSLREIYIPGGIAALDSMTFDGCISLRTIRFGGTMEQWRALLAQGYNSIDTTYITVHCVDGTILAGNA